MKDDKVRKNPIDLRGTKATILDIHRGHLLSRHHSSYVKLLGDVKVRGQPKKLDKLCKLDVEPSAISHPHEDPLFLIKEESGIELCDDLLVPVVPKLQNFRDAMKVTSFKNFVEGGILLLPHIVKVNPLHQDNMLDLPVKHRAIPILMEGSPKMLIGAPFLGLVVAQDLTKRHDVSWINLVIVDHFPVGVNFRESHLQALKLIGSGRSGTTRWGVLRRGVLMKTVVPCPLGKILELSSRSPA
jgi:hypothetical protein